MNIIFLALFLILLALSVEVAAIALKITGLDISKARFQALSALTGTGFTTMESELVAQHPARRRVIMSLMIIGYIGMATIVTGLLDTVRNTNQLTLIQGGVAVLVLLSGVSIFTNKWLIGHLDRQIEKHLVKQQELHRRPVEQVLRLDGEYGVAEVLLEENSCLVGSTIVGARLRDKGIFVLAIERGNEFIHSPRGSAVLKIGDRLILYGRLSSIRELIVDPEGYCSVDM